ncbi:hypothetical protein PENTCL1PPCAC_20877, partial [Pristionchus entomophagus]
MALINIIMASYGVPIFATYILVVISVIALRKELSSSFLWIYLIMAGVNLTTYFSTWWTHRLRSEPFWFWYYEWSMLPGVELWRTIHQFLASYFFYAQNSCAFMFTANRFTSIVFPGRHQDFWRRFHWRLQGFIHIISFGICVATRWPSKANFVYSTATEAYLTVPLVSTVPYLIGMMSYGIPMLLICSVANSMCIYRLVKFTKLQNRKEFSFSLISVCIFITQAINICLVIVSASCTIGTNSACSIAVSTYTPFTSDFLSLGPAVYTMLVPGPIRRQAFKILYKTIGKSYSSSFVAPNCDDHGGRTLFKLRPKDAEKGFVAFVCEHNFVKEKDHWLLYSRRLLRLKHTMMGGKITCGLNSRLESSLDWAHSLMRSKAEEMMRLCREE